MEDTINEFAENLNLVREDEEARNNFISQYKPFIASFTSECTHRYVKYGIDDELSIALLAFNEAIDRFNGKGNFLLYAKLVIKTRLIDYVKSSAYRENKNSFALYTEEDDEIEALKDTAIDIYNKDYENSIRIMEIQEFNKQLAVFNITFMDLVKVSPKHLITRKLIHSLITDLLNNAELVSKIMETHVLPLKEIEKNYLIPRKKMESYRKYIIAVIVLANSEFDTLKEFLPIKL